MLALTFTVHRYPQVLLGVVRAELREGDDFGVLRGRHVAGRWRGQYCRWCGSGDAELGLQWDICCASVENMQMPSGYGVGNRQPGSQAGPAWSLPLAPFRYINGGGSGDDQAWNSNLPIWPRPAPIIVEADCGVCHMPLSTVLVAQKQSLLPKFVCGR